MVWATILVIEIVGMFPYIKSKQGNQAFLNRIGRIRLLCNHKFTVFIG